MELLTSTTRETTWKPTWEATTTSLLCLPCDVLTSVVLSFKLLIRKNGIGFSDISEDDLGLFLGLVAIGLVWVVHQREFAIRLLDFSIACTPLDTKNFVIVLLFLTVQAPLEPHGSSG